MAPAELNDSLNVSSPLLGDFIQDETIKSIKQCQQKNPGGRHINVSITFCLLNFMLFNIFHMCEVPDGKIKLFELN